MKTITKEELIDRILQEVDHYKAAKDWRGDAVVGQLYIALSNLIK